MDDMIELKYIIGAVILLIIGIVMILCMAKRDSDYFDWLGNYNLPKDLKDYDKRKPYK